MVRVSLAALCLALCCPAALHAVDLKKAAAWLAQRAAAAYESGDMDKAASLYHEALRKDPSEPNCLYGAARAEQSAGRLDRAEQDY